MVHHGGGWWENKADRYWWMMEIRGADMTHDRRRETDVTSLPTSVRTSSDRSGRIIEPAGPAFDIKHIKNNTQ